MFYGEMFNGVEDTAINEGYMVMVCNTGNVISEKDYIQKLMKRKIDGMIYNTYEVKPGIIKILKTDIRRNTSCFLWMKLSVPGKCIQCGYRWILFHDK